ncbi:MCE family protein [Undibacterium sp. CY18W]|uniref:MCE family protein n=1 Tax=Undibacterium hunanense TaxID=2762292 RepID=A0ABR6ZYA6_9BURK|nr:MlaD family protein [Undibacterium hunanense]MBC3920868.1 MCE family protein [Undibacterium hunanense]
METKVNYAAVGAFVLALGALLVAAVLWLSVGLGKRTQTILYQSVVSESVAGLNLDAPVKYQGVNVGKVHAISLDPANPQQVQLLFAIAAGTPIKTDTQAVLKTQGLTGIAYVELSGGSPAAPALQALPGQDYPQIRTKPSLSARLENVLSAVLANLDRTAANVNAILNEDNRAAFSKILQDTSAVMDALASQKATMRVAISNAAITTNNTAQASAKLDALFQRIGKSADAVAAMADKAGQASDSARTAVDQLGGGVRQISTDTLPEIQRLMAELATLSASLTRLIEQTEHNPSSLIRGRQPAPPGPGESKGATP